MKKNIAVLAGGNSSEHFISLQSAETISKSINREKYNVYTVLIINQEWTIQNKSLQGVSINKDNFTFTSEGEVVNFDCVFSAIHGAPGENGQLQSYFEMLEIPFTGCNSFVSALTFNKYQCNIFLKEFGINVAKASLIGKNSPFNSAKIIEKIGLPCFVKPNAGGSSFGISKVKVSSDFENAAQEAFKESNEVIAEEFIEGREITCGVYKVNGEFNILPLAEIISKNEFFDYEAKYNSELNQELVPAPLSKELTLECQELTKKIYSTLNCNGIVRVDYILSNEKFYLLEINTIPGMTAESLVPKMINESGRTLTKVTDEIIMSII